MFLDNKYQVFGSELLDADCLLPPLTSASMPTASNGVNNCITNERQTGFDGTIKRYVAASKDMSFANLIVC